MLHTKSDGTVVRYETEQHKNAGFQTVFCAVNRSGKSKLKHDRSGDGEHYRRIPIGTYKDYGGWGAGADRDPNTGRQVLFNRVEGKIKGVVKVNGCVVYGN